MPHRWPAGQNWCPRLQSAFATRASQALAAPSAGCPRRWWRDGATNHSWCVVHLTQAAANQCCNNLLCRPCAAAAVYTLSHGSMV